jgi:hypothetical protein
MARTWSWWLALSLITWTVAGAGENLLQVDFEEATAGGRITPISPEHPKGGNSTGISAGVGVFAVFPNDAAMVTQPGLDGSDKALRVIDEIKDRGLRLDLVLARPVTRGKLALRWDVKVSPAVSSDNPFAVSLVCGGQVFCTVNFRATDKSLYATNDARRVAGFPESFIGPPQFPDGVLVLGEAVRYELLLNLDTMKYDLAIKRIADGSELYRSAGRTMVHVPNLREQGLTVVRLGFGAPDFAQGGGDADRWVEVDNIVASVAE